MIADRYDAFLFDLDGVLYRGAEPIDGAAETLATLRNLGKGLAFLTNNSSRTPEAIAAHLTGMGIRAAPEEIETSARGAAAVVPGGAGARAHGPGAFSQQTRPTKAEV
jgi:glycerol 3-phosphatase-2